MTYTDKQRITEFYDQRCVEYGDDLRTVAWGSRQSQQSRFRVLSEIAELDRRVILDVGCGLGDFYGYLLSQGMSVQYVGCDISAKVIDIARTKYPAARFELKDILEDRTPSRFDYVFASGTFNRRVTDGDSVVKAMVRRMYEMATLGAGFNMMSTYAKFFNEDEYYAQPEALFSFCKSLTSRVVLRHDYMPHDFTIWMYRETNAGS